MKTKLTAFLLTLTLAAGLLTGCGSKPATSGPQEPEDKPGQETQDPAAADAVKTGLSIITSVSKSEDASAESDGTAQTNVNLVAVTVTDDGVIDSCVIDAIQPKIAFSTEGKIVTPADTRFASKNELGADYGMGKASAIGKEWSEQAAAFADYAVGKTVEDLKGIALSEDGNPADADLAASVTLSVGSFLSGIEAAVGSARHLGAQAGDKLALTSITTMSKSKDASAEGDGTAQAYASVAAVTLRDETVTSCYIDAVQANVTFDTTGKITSDLAAPVATKNEIGDGYGMIEASSIGKEWYQQIESFCQYVTGKTVDEIAGIAVSETTVPTGEDLAASVTIKIGEYLELIAKAAK